MNYREAAIACQGLVKRGAFDDGAIQLWHLTRMDPYNELSRLSRRPTILRYYLRHADRVFKVPLPVYEYDQKVSKDDMMLTPITALTPGLYRHTIARHVKERDKPAGVRLKQTANTPFRALGNSPAMKLIGRYAPLWRHNLEAVWQAAKDGKTKELMDDALGSLARFYTHEEEKKSGVALTEEARQARIKELNREFRQRFIPATAPASKAAPAPVPAPAATPATNKTTATTDATAAASNDPDVLRKLLEDEQIYRRWESNRADQILAMSMEQQDRADYEKKRRAAAERRAKINHYGLVAGGALAGGTGAGLLSYLLAPRMSGLGRALTMVGGAAAGGAAAHYGSELVNDWIASR